jgi:cobalt-zinc-cadmium efflux system membrane fusion protein
VIAREGGRGELVAAEKEIYTVADLSVVWVEIPVYGLELPYLRKGQRVLLKGPSGRTGEGRLVLISPTSDPQTGAARAVAELDNASSEWRPGDFLSGMIATESEPADIAVPGEALQMLAGETVVFVRTNEGFEKRIVEIGRRNARSAEIVFGLFPGDRIAASNTFLLKAEASRGSAEHAHSH